MLRRAGASLLPLGGTGLLATAGRRTFPRCLRTVLPGCGNPFGSTIPRQGRGLPGRAIHLALQLRLVEKRYHTGEELPFTVLKEDQRLAIPQLAGKNGTKPHATAAQAEPGCICTGIATFLVHAE